MRALFAVIFVAAGCGDDGATPADAGVDARIDAPPSNCQPLPAMGQFNRRAGNPKLLPKPMQADGKLDLAIADPDVHFDSAANKFEIYYQSPRGTSFTDPAPAQVIRHATATADRATFTVDDTPAFTVGEVGAWDHTHAETPTVIYNPAAPADRRYLLMYSGAAAEFPNYGFPEYAIGAAFSADGKTFTRVSAADSPHGKAGLVLTGAQTYPGAMGAIVADPELALVDGVYHLWFSSFACTGANCATITDFGVAHATSADGITWTVQQAPVISLLRASANRTTGGQQPSVIYDAVHCRYEMWLRNDLAGETDAQPVVFNNMAGVYHADSTDGITWFVNYTSARDLKWNAAEAGEPLGLLTGADVADANGGRLMLYVGFDDQNVPPGFLLPDRSQAGARPGVMVLNTATRDLP